MIKDKLIPLGITFVIIAGAVGCDIANEPVEETPVEEVETTSMEEYTAELRKQTEKIEELEQENANLEEQLEEEQSRNTDISNNTVIPESPIQSYDGISIGDKIQTWGHDTYDTYEEFIDYYKLPKAMWFDHQAISRYDSGQRYGGEVNPDYVYEVVFIAKHLDQETPATKGRVIYVVQKDNKIYMLDKSNIKEVL